jgi:site-specific DNA-cytosine methylase
VAAIDIDRRIVPIYRANHLVEPSIRAIESIQQVPTGDLWWLSPPCQPYTRRGQGRGEQDARSAGLGRIIELMERERPRGVMLENVPEFLGSRHHQQIERGLTAAGYSVRVDELCPSQWNVPMRRRRVYLRARRDGNPMAPVTTENVGRPLADYLDPAAWDDAKLRVPDSIASRFERAMHVVDAEAECAIAACFTSAYGKSPVRAGSYLRSDQHPWLRRFSPQEVGRLMGYRQAFWWPDELSLRARYHLLGNALSVTVVRALLSTMKDLG